MSTTPTPWSLHYMPGDTLPTICGGGGPVAEPRWEVGDAEGMANARLIVRAVNAHDALVAALNRFVDDFCECDRAPDGRVLNECRGCEATTALKLAQEKP